MVGAHGEDVEAIVGLREGPLPPDWAGRLRHRGELPGIEVAVDVLRAEALVPLRAFRASGQPAYNPGAG